MNLTLLYDMGKFREARDFVDTTRKYFSKSSDLTEFYRKRHTNFLKYYSLLLKYADMPDRVSAEMDYKKLQGENLVSNRRWLLSRMEKFII